MSTTNQNPTGELVLVDYFHESSSGHFDTSRVVKLFASDDGFVILEENETENNQFKGPGHDRTSRWKIDREALIDLIKENATKR